MTSDAMAWEIARLMLAERSKYSGIVPTYTPPVGVDFPPGCLPDEPLPPIEEKPGISPMALAAIAGGGALLLWALSRRD